MNEEWKKINIRDGWSKGRGKISYNLGDVKGEKNNKAKLKEKDVKDIIERLKKGELMKYIAKDYNVSITQISHIKLGKSWGYMNNEIIPKSYSYQQGENNHKSKLNINQVLQIKEMIGVKISDREIGKLFNVSYSQIARIRRGENWKHIK